MSTNILIVEDDLDLGNLLKQYLELNGFKAQRVFDGREAFERLKTCTYDLLILDVMMPTEDGFTLARKLNTFYEELPFLFVTAKKMREDVLQGLKLGAEDYIIKPFDADELVLRIRNILKRRNNIPKNKPEIFTIGTLVFDPNNLQLKSGNETKLMTEKEAQLLHYFCLHQNELIKRENVLTYLWKEPDFFNSRSMDVFISRLRKLLGADPTIRIESIRGVGFRFYTGDTL